MIIPTHIHYVSMNMSNPQILHSYWTSLILMCVCTQHKLLAISSVIKMINMLTWRHNNNNRKSSNFFVVTIFNVLLRSIRNFVGKYFYKKLQIRNDPKLFPDWGNMDSHGTYIPNKFCCCIFTYFYIISFFKL